MYHTRLESMFWKNYAPHIHSHKSWHIHAHHVHTHDTLYARVYTCTHCGSTGHIVKFCYDRIHAPNFANKFIWVRKCVNPHGLKQIWVPKFTPILFDIRWALTQCESIGALMVDAFWAWWILHWMHLFQRCLVGGPPWFEDLEIGSFG